MFTDNQPIKITTPFTGSEGRHWAVLSLSKPVGFVSLFGKPSLVSISAAILFLRSWHVYFPLEFEFRGKSCVEREHGGENGISCLLPCILLLYIEWIWTNYCKLSRNFVGAIRTTTINCRVSFIDLYLVFPRNFRMIFLPHTNTVILLELYCGTITEPGLPVDNAGPGCGTPESVENTGCSMLFVTTAHDQKSHHCQLMSFLKWISARPGCL